MQPAPNPFDSLLGAPYVEAIRAARSLADHSQQARFIVRDQALHITAHAPEAHVWYLAVLPGHEPRAVRNVPAVQGSPEVGSKLILVQTGPAAFELLERPW